MVRRGVRRAASVQHDQRALRTAHPFSACHLLAQPKLRPGQHLKSAAVGEPVLMEIELIEPNLFMIWSEGAAIRFATVLADFAARSPFHR